MRGPGRWMWAPIHFCFLFMYCLHFLFRCSSQQPGFVLTDELHFFTNCLLLGQFPGMPVEYPVVCFFLWYLQSSTCNGQWRSVFRCIWAGEWNHLWFNAHRAEHLHWNNNSDRSTFSAELFCMGQCTWAPAPASSLHTQGPALSFYLILRLLTPHPGPIIFFFHGRSKLGLRPPFLPPALLSVTGIVWSRCSGIGDKHMIINKMLTHLYFSSLGYFWQTEAWLSLSIYQDCVITLLTSLNKWPKPVGFKS